MKSFCTPGPTILSPLSSLSPLLQPSSTRLILTGIAALLLTLAAFGAQAKDGELSKDDQACLKCHDKPGMEKKLGDGETLSLEISTKAYQDSMHNGTSCADCHSELDAKTHGKEKTAVKSKREFSLGMRETCRDCHKKKFTQFEDSVHVAVQKAGSKKAPLCSDCHNPHTVKSQKIVRPMAETPCAKCHDDIYKAYSTDVHGQLRSTNGKEGKGAPICADCHRAHDVKAASLGENMKDTCLTCHKEAVAQHKDWLPNAELHFEAISCPTCHAPTAQRRVNLRLYDGVAKQQMAEKKGVPKFEKRTDAADEKDVGLDERALWSLLKEFNQDGPGGKTILRGRLEVKTGADAHRLSTKEKAIKDCNVCHQSGAEAFQSVTLTIAGPDGRPLRHGVQKEVLNSLTSMESVRGFYAIGSTRIKLLDTLLILVVLGSIGGPLMHMTIKFVAKRAREKHAAELLAEAAIVAKAAGGVASDKTSDGGGNAGADK